MQHTWAVRDEHGVVHALPEDWGRSSYKAVCGEGGWTPDPLKDEAITCLICLGTRRMWPRAGEISTVSFTWSSSVAGRTSRSRAAAASSAQPVHIVTMDSNTPTRRRRV